MDAQDSIAVTIYSLGLLITSAYTAAVFKRIVSSPMADWALFVSSRFPSLPCPPLANLPSLRPTPSIPYRIELTFYGAIWAACVPLALALLAQVIIAARNLRTIPEESNERPVSMVVVTSMVEVHKSESSEVEEVEGSSSEKYRARGREMLGVV